MLTGVVSLLLIKAVAVFSAVPAFRSLSIAEGARVAIILAGGGSERHPFPPYPPPPRALPSL